MMCSLALDTRLDWSPTGFERLSAAIKRHFARQVLSQRRAILAMTSLMVI